MIEVKQVSTFLRRRLYYLHRRNLSSTHERGVKVKSKLSVASKDVRRLFIDYFANEKNHVYVPSSPVYLKNDPSLLFVNAGMNRFKSKLLDRVSPKHNYYHLERAVNSQKCIRMSGKHNDLDNVGQDFHHHTFFEMLGNWSFGDYFKKEACEMAWEMLTKVYGLPKDRLYVTYFGGDSNLNLPPDIDCQNIWLNIGVPESHIFPYGAKDNFWDMGDTGPCGPCSEIHYDFIGKDNSTMPPNERINAGCSDLIEIWNLVFIQYNRGKNGDLELLQKYSVDTGMGFERLCAVLQGTMSNYDTDIFQPLFSAVEKNFKIQPYGRKIGKDDIHGVDTAYRIVSDHARMFSVSIADGLFPDNFGAGHVLRKVIRRAAYMANRVLKTHPGMLSSLVPYVAESLDFFPEIEKQSKEIMMIVNEEEKLFHSTINKGRKARNKMASEAKNNILEGKDVYDLRYSYGLEENVIQDLAEESKLKVDWESYEKLVHKKEELAACDGSGDSKTAAVSPGVIEMLKIKQVPLTDDSHKYNSHSSSRTIEDISANIIAIVQNDALVDAVESNEPCFIVTDQTNFYSHAGGQIADTGVISNKNFVFNVEDVYCLEGYVFHKGKATAGEVISDLEVTMCVDEKHRNGCMCNHTATHLINAALNRVLPYTVQTSSYVGPTHLKLGFSAKAALTTDQLTEIENFVRNAIHEKLNVSRNQMHFDELQSIPNVILLCGEEYPDNVSVIIIGDNETNLASNSVEPCCGTHVQNTADLGEFAIVQSKSTGGSSKTLHAVTGEIAKTVLQNGKTMHQRLQDIEHRIHVLQAKNADNTEYLNVLKDVRKFLHDCHHLNDVPIITLRNCEERLKEIRYKLLEFSGSDCGTDKKLEENEKNSTNESVKKSRVPDKILHYIENSGIPHTRDSHKYDFSCNNGKQNVVPVSATILAIFQNENVVTNVERGLHCVIVTDKTNCFAENSEQAGDKGTISTNEGSFIVTDVYEKNGFVFHEGWLSDGVMRSNSEACLKVDGKHRQSCSLNHTGLHLLHSSLKNIFPDIYPQSAFAGASDLLLEFKFKSLPMDQLGEVERAVNDAIRNNFMVSRRVVPANELKTIPNIVLSPTKKYSDPVAVISIGSNSPNSKFISVEPCSGTHAVATSHIGQFLITSSKQKNQCYVIRAVTGDNAKDVSKKGELYHQYMSEIEQRVLLSLESEKPDYLEMLDLLREVKIAKNRHETDLPFLLFRRHQDYLTELTIKLSNCTKEFIQKGFSEVKEEMKSIIERCDGDKYVIHRLNCLGDGKKLINYALASIKNKPALFIAADGHKSVICSCSMPKHCTSSQLSALLWIQPVATVLKGRARSHTKDPELFYSIESCEVDKVDEAITVARQYIESNL